MAEIISVQQEKLLPVYELMKKVNLVSENDFRTIINKRSELDQILSKKAPESALHLAAYIEYDFKILKGVKNHYLRNVEEHQKTFETIEKYFAQHLRSLCKQYLFVQPHDERIYEFYITLCMRCNFLSDVSGIYDKYLKYHQDNVNIWVRAIQWEYNKMNNMEKVKELFHKGTQYHHANEGLCFEFFHVMLKEANKIWTEHNNINKTNRALGDVEIIYNDYVSKFSNINYFKKVLETLDEYPFAKKLQRTVASDALKKFGGDELLWHILAQRELNGFVLSDLMSNDEQENQQISTEQVENVITINEKNGNGYTIREKESMDQGQEQRKTQEQEQTEQQEDDQMEVQGQEQTNDQEMEEEEVEEKVLAKLIKNPLKQRIRLCVGTYQKAVRKVPTQLMWTYYIDTMLELNKDLKTHRQFKIEMLKYAFQSGFNANLLSENHFEILIRMLKNKDNFMITDEGLERIMKKSVELHPNSINLWKQWLIFHIQKDNMEKVHEILHKAQKKLASKSYPLWEMVIFYNLTETEKRLTRLDDIFKEAVLYSNEFLIFRAQYLEWTLLTKNSMDAVRRNYNDMLKLSPPDYNMISKMILLESRQIDPDYEKWRSCHESAVKYFGRERKDVWIDYIKFEKNHGSLKLIENLYTRAKCTLDERSLQSFDCEYKLLKRDIFDL